MARQQQAFPDTASSNNFHPDAYLKIDPRSPGFRESVWSSNDTLFFKFVDDDIAESVDAQYEEISILGRSENYQIYSNTNNRDINLNLTFFAQGDSLGGGSFSDTVKKEVVDRCNWIKALAYPHYTEVGQMFAPPRVLLNFGKLYEGIFCLVKNPQITWMTPFDTDTLYPMQAKVSLALTVVNDKPLSSRDILNGG